MDPVPVYVCAGLVGFVLLAGAAHKLRDVAGFGAVVDEYRLLPRGWGRGAARVLVAAEIALGAGVLLGEPLASAGAIALLLAYAAAIAINVARGRRDIDCGCGGLASRQTLGWGLVARNAVLTGAAAATLLPRVERTLAPLDWYTVVAAVVALSFGYVAVNELVAQWPRTRALA
jgi:hypothetical protein